jgi:hypothetical protein
MYIEILLAHPILHISRIRVNRPFKIVRCFGMEINVGKTKVLRNPMQPSHIEIMVD